MFNPSSEITNDKDGGAYIVIVLVTDQGPYSPVIPAVRTLHLIDAPSLYDNVGSQ